MKTRLKIAEQILIVLSLALILPLIIAAAIIINTNQIAVRKELISSAALVANSFIDELSAFEKFEKNNIIYLNKALDNMPTQMAKQNFIDFIKQDDTNIINISRYRLSAPINSSEEVFTLKYLNKDKRIVFSLVSPNNIALDKVVTIDYINRKILDNFNAGQREVYVFDSNKNLILSKNMSVNTLNTILKEFPAKIDMQKPIIFGSEKNQPNILVYNSEYNWYIVVSSPKSLTYYGIIAAKRKIILSICVAAIFVFIIFGIFTYSLYVNIRQIFKTIKYIAAGKYSRKIRILISAFTPQELIFIADEFNKMVETIDESYKKLNESNKKLQQLYDYKSNLIDTVSHEFRTPLTSIKGYSSSLLRHGTQLDEETRKKSLKIIKHQSERLSRMVEDLLVIPDIESCTLRMDCKEVNIKDIIETAILSTSKTDTSNFEVNITEPLNNVYSDEDRLMQVFINLLENALKYSKENTKIQIFATTDNDFATITIHNECEHAISKEETDKLFEKFTRLDSKLTRTTRGTGLGLFIVKGLIETLGGNVSINSDNGFDVIFTIPVYKGQDLDAR